MDDGCGSAHTMRFMTVVLKFGNVAPVQGHRLDRPEDAAPIALRMALERGEPLDAAIVEAEEAVESAEEAPTGELVHRRKLAAFELDKDLAAEHEGCTVTTYVFPGEMGEEEVLATVGRTWETYHSDDPPEWVEGDGSEVGEALARLLARRYSWPARDEVVDEDGDVTVEGRAEHVCVVGRPDGWKGLE
jgi:hypothetical protein